MNITHSLYTQYTSDYTSVISYKKGLLIMELKVNKTSDPKKVAGAIASNLREGNDVKIIVIGPAAVNQAIKSIIIARGYIATNGFDLTVVPSFTKVSVTDSDEQRSAVVLEVTRSEDE